MLILTKKPICKSYLKPLSKYKLTLLGGLWVLLVHNYIRQSHSPSKIASVSLFDCYCFIYSRSELKFILQLDHKHKKHILRVSCWIFLSVNTIFAQIVPKYTPFLIKHISGLTVIIMGISLSIDNIHHS